ncbi:MAG: YicC/YloC family endoribonuclease [Methyloligellaceae bacterium]
MALKSMTGFSRREGGQGGLSWYWEVRTVNGRGLDVRLRLPQGYDSIETKVREALKRRLTRGSCQVTLTVRRPDGAAEIRLNEAAFAQVVEAVSKAADLVDASSPSIDRLLSIKGVLEFVEPEEDEAVVAAQHEAMLADLDAAIDGVIEARAREGQRLEQVISGQIDEIEELSAAVEGAPGRTPDAIGLRLKEQVARLLESGAQLDEQRLHQEAVLLAAKADIREEIDRLNAHVAAARELMSTEEPVGRRLEFLAQEFNREANTICSKSIDPQLTRDGLTLKAVIDRVREQVQNIE